MELLWASGLTEAPEEALIGGLGVGVWAFGDRGVNSLGCLRGLGPKKQRVGPNEPTPPGLPKEGDCIGSGLWPWKPCIIPEKAFMSMNILARAENMELSAIPPLGPAVQPKPAAGDQKDREGAKLGKCE